MPLPTLQPFDATLPLAEAHTLPASWYTGAEVASAEAEAIFARSWQYVGRAEQVQQPGQYLTVNIAREPVLVVRGDDGVLRGFFNVCRHRAAPILDEPSGCVGKLRCRYHGWTYDLRGALRGTPEFDGVCSFEKTDNGLMPVGAVIEHGPFVFVHLEARSQSFEESYTPFTAWLATQPDVTKLKWFQRTSYDLQCNWKVYVDNYLDGGYHVNTVHPALAGAIDYGEYRTDVFPTCSLQSSPLQATDGAVGSTRTGVAAYWWLWPNFMVNAYSGVMDTNLVLPLGPEKCRVIFDFWFSPDSTESFRRDSIAVAEQVQEEDILISEQVQRGLNSRSYTTGRFSVKREAGGYAFHQLVAKSFSTERFLV
jgi:choline monooxygenase